VKNNKKEEHKKSDKNIKEKMLGAGQFGTCYLYIHKETGKKVAVKKIELKKDNKQFMGYAFKWRGFLAKG
jgi:serine/threonine protein kinase